MSERLRSGSYSTEKAAGALAAAAWLSARGLRVAPGTRWEVAIALDVVNHAASPTVTSATDSRFHIAISANEWGFFFCHGGRVSWIRVTDVPFVNERDEFTLLAQAPPLRDLGSLVQNLEEQHKLQFRRKHASVRSSIAESERTIRLWLAASI